MERMSSTDTLIADLYESVLRPELIPGVLARINTLMDCDGLHLVGKDEEREVVFASIVIGDRLKEAEHDYLAYFHRIDPRLSIGRSMPTGLCAACHDYLDDDFVGRSEFYQELLIPHGLRYIVGGNVFREGSKNIHLVMNHGTGREPFQGEKREAIERWMYHLSRWATQLMAADQLRQAVGAATFGLETLGQGLLLLDDRARVQFANQAALDLLGDGLAGKGFRKSFRPAAELLGLVRQVISDRQARTMTLARPKGSWLCSVLPFPREHEAAGPVPTELAGLTSPPAGPGASWNPGVASVVVLIRPESMAPASRLYAQSFGLTPAEVRLAEALAQHMAPRDYADRSGVSVATVRTQIRAILAKTGAVNLRALVVLLSQLPNA